MIPVARCATRQRFSMLTLRSTSAVVCCQHVRSNRRTCRSLDDQLCARRWLAEERRMGGLHPEGLDAESSHRPCGCLGVATGSVLATEDEAPWEIGLPESWDGDGFEHRCERLRCQPATGPGGDLGRAVVIKEGSCGLVGSEHDPTAAVDELNDVVLAREPASSRSVHGLSFEGQSCGEIDDVSYPVESGIGGDAGDEAAHRVTDEHVARLYEIDYRVAVAREGRFLVDSRTMAGEVYCDCGMAPQFEFREEEVPAPGRVEPSVDEYEAQRAPTQPV